VNRPDTRPQGKARLRLPVLIASGLGSGFSRAAPGTMGSLAALIPGVVLSAHTGLLLASILAACAAGLWAIPRASGGADHGWVVIDEVAGQWITLLGIPPLRDPRVSGALLHEAAWLAAAFAMFRLLDVTKPGPVAALDRRHDAFGVMGDDILAGLLGAALLGLARLVLHAGLPA
jgi:phosphatidylglycerophosphatase A